MNPMIERKRMFDFACRRLDFLSKSNPHCHNVRPKFITVALAFIEKNEEFLQPNHKALFNRLKRSPYLKNQLKIFDLLTLDMLALFVNRVTTSNVLIICKDEEFLFANSTVLASIPYFKAACNTLMKKNLLKDELKIPFPKLENTFTLDQFSKHALATFFKIANKPSAVIFTDIALLFQVYTIADYLSFSELKSVCIESIVNKILLSGDESLSLIPAESPNLDLFLKEFATECLKRLAKKNLRFFIELANKPFAEELIPIIEIVKKWLDSSSESIITRRGEVIDLISHFTCYATFKAVPPERIMSGKEEGSVLGMCSSGYLWISSYGGELKPMKLFSREGLKLVYHQIRIENEGDIELAPSWECFEVFGLLPGEHISTSKGSGAVLGMCKSRYLRVQFYKEKDVGEYKEIDIETITCGTFKSKDDLFSHDFALSNRFDIKSVQSEPFFNTLSILLRTLRF